MCFLWNALLVHQDGCGRILSSAYKPTGASPILTPPLQRLLLLLRTESCCTRARLHNTRNITMAAAPAALDYVGLWIGSYVLRAWKMRSGQESCGKLCWSYSPLAKCNDFAITRYNSLLACTHRALISLLSNCRRIWSGTQKRKIHLRTCLSRIQEKKPHLRTCRSGTQEKQNHLRTCLSGNQKKHKLLGTCPSSHTCVPL